MAIDPRALQGSAYTSLGSLYYQVPGWPIGFGDDKRAEAMLLKALEINPDGIDPNYFYGITCSARSAMLRPAPRCSAPWRHPTAPAGRWRTRAGATKPARCWPRSRPRSTDTLRQLDTEREQASMRILLVEDDTGLGEGIRTALKPEGYTVDWLRDGRSALHALTHESFDLAVLDLGLPRMDGSKC
jgi:hypothetical protein